MCSAKYALTFAKLKPSENNLSDFFTHSMFLVLSSAQLSAVLIMKALSRGVCPVHEPFFMR